MANKQMQKCPTSLAIKENQIKTKRGTTTRPLEWLRLKRLTKPIVGEDVRKMEFSFLS